MLRLPLRDMSHRDRTSESTYMPGQLTFFSSFPLPSTPPDHVTFRFRLGANTDGRKATCLPDSPARRNPSRAAFDGPPFLSVVSSALRTSAAGQFLSTKRIHVRIAGKRPGRRVPVLHWLLAVQPRCVVLTESHGCSSGRLLQISVQLRKWLCRTFWARRRALDRGYVKWQCAN